MPASDNKITVRMSQRVNTAQRDLIKRGAAATGMSVSQFVVSNAVTSAELAIMDQRVIYLDGEEFDAFVARLGEPPQPNPGIELLFSKKSDWANSPKAD